MTATVLQPGRYTAVCYADVPDVDEHIAAGNTEARMRSSILANFGSRPGGFAREPSIATQGEFAWLVTRHIAADDTINFNLSFTLDSAQNTDWLGTQVLNSINWYAQNETERNADARQRDIWYYRFGSGAGVSGSGSRFANGVRPARAHTTWTSYVWYVFSSLDGTYVMVEVRNGEAPRATNSSDSAIGRGLDYVNPAPERQSSTEPSRDGNTPLQNVGNWGILDTLKVLAIGGLVVGGIIGIAVIATNVRKAIS